MSSGQGIASIARLSDLDIELVLLGTSKVSERIQVVTPFIRSWHLERTIWHGLDISAPSIIGSDRIHRLLDCRGLRAYLVKMEKFDKYVARFALRLR